MPAAPLPKFGGKRNITFLCQCHAMVCARYTRRTRHTHTHWFQMVSALLHAKGSLRGRFCLVLADSNGRRQTKWISSWLAWLKTRGYIAMATGATNKHQQVSLAADAAIKTQKWAGGRGRGHVIAVGWTWIRKLDGSFMTSTLRYSTIVFVLFMRPQQAFLRFAPKCTADFVSSFFEHPSNWHGWACCGKHVLTLFVVEMMTMITVPHLSTK